MKIRIRQARGKFAAMAGTYSLGVFNDNFFKQAAIFLAIAAGLGHLRGIAAALIALPYVLFASYAGWLADRFPKRNVVIGAKVLELVAMTCGAVGIYTGSWWMILSMVFLTGLQSAIFSPALNGSIPELYPASYVTTANAVLRIVTTSTILLGVVLAGYALDLDGQGEGITIGERLVVSLTVIAVSLLGLVISFGVPRRPAAAPHVRFPWSGPAETFRQLVKIHKDTLLAKVVWTNVFVWSVGSLQILIISKMGKVQFRLGEAMTGNMVFAELVGIAVGGFLASRIAAGRWYRVFAPSAIAITALSLLIGATPWLEQSMRVPAMFVLLAFTGIAGGLCLIPCESFIQVRPDPREKGAVIAAANFVVFCGIIISGMLVYALDDILKSTTFFASSAVVTGAVSVWLIIAFRGEEN